MVTGMKLLKFEDISRGLMGHVVIEDISRCLRGYVVIKTSRDA